MKGLELARAFYEECGAPMIRERFPQFESLIAVGLVGAGSECFGYDDDHSHDHDFEPGFCLFLPGEDLIDSRSAFALERAYAKLPREFMGYARLTSPPAGGYRHGVIRTDDFYTERIGQKDAYDDPMQWFAIPEHFLAEAVNGEVFRDDLGRFSDVRERMKTYPEDVRLKKLAGHLWLAAQCAPYNYERCLAHGEKTAAAWALWQFADHALSCAFLLGKVYRPFYKWAFRALRALPRMSEAEPLFERLLTGGQEGKAGAVEEIASLLTSELRLQSLINSDSPIDGDSLDLARHALAVNDRVADPNIRNLNLLYGV